MMNLLHELAELHDDTLLSQLDDLVRRDRCSCARIVAHVAEVDARKLYLDRGSPSMIDYARRVLGFSESAAYRRVTAARLARRFPVLLDRIASGAVHLTALTILGPHLDEENCERLVDAASGKSRLELEALVAPLRAPVTVDPRTVVRAVRVAEAPAAGEGGAGLFDSVGETGSEGPGSRAGKGARGQGLGAVVGGAGAAAEGTDPKPAAGLAASANCRGGGTAEACDATARTPSRLAYRLSATLSPETKALLDRAAELLRRDVRPGDVDALLQRALRLLVDTTEARRFGKVRRPRARRLVGAAAGTATTTQAGTVRPTPAGSVTPTPTHTALTTPTGSSDLPTAPPSTADPNRRPTRTIPAAVRRAVAERDGHRCTFVAADGRRCPERGALEFHHRQAFAHGGAATADNIILLCAAHHRRVSEQQFGKFLVRDEPRGGANYANSRLARVRPPARGGMGLGGAASGNSRLARLSRPVHRGRGVGGGIRCTGSWPGGVLRGAMRSADRVVRRPRQAQGANRS
jgi:uncharacterized protein (DUF1778 family)